jgi:hypothetical protein
MLKISILLLILSITIQGIAQQTLILESVNEKNNYITVLGFQRDYLNSLYHQKVDDIDALIDGRDYVPYYFRSKLKPLLLNDKKRTGSITLNGRKYNNLTLEYDTYLDELIYSDKNKFINDRLFKIALNKDPVDGFGLYFEDDSLIFRHFKSNDKMKFNLPEGFYEVVYDGKTKYIRKHQSFGLETDGIVEYFYTSSEYVMVGDMFYKISSPKSFIKLFGERSDEIKKFIRVNRVHIRKGDKREIAIVLKYYDTLIMSEKPVK